MNTTRTALLCVALTLGAPACYRLLYTQLSAADLAERGTRKYGNATREQAMEACTAAAETLGYRVTLKRADTGVIKTAPVSIMKTSTGGNGSAQVTDDGLAWNITIEQPADGRTVIRLVPRAFRNGSEIDQEGIWVAEVMDAKFRDLWREIENNLGVLLAPAASSKK